MSKDTDITKGWDTVFALRYPQLNARLSAAYNDPKCRLPRRFDASVSGLLGQLAVAGDWGPWQVTTGGSGRLLHMCCPIRSGKLTMDDQPKSDLRGMEVVIQVRLQLVKHDTSARDLTGYSHKLVVHHEAGDSGEPPVAVVAIRDAHGRALNPADQAALEGPLLTWFDDHLQEFDHVFALVDLNDKIATGDFAWVKPLEQGVAYACAEDASPEATPEERMASSVFAVLCKTEGRVSKHLAAEINTNAIPAGEEAAFCFSREMYLEHFVMSALPLLFQLEDATNKDIPTEQLLEDFRRNFQVQNDGKCISNIRKLKLPEMQLGDDGKGRRVQPVVDAGSFRFEIDGTLLRIEFSPMSFEYIAGVHVHLYYSSTARLTLKDGTISLVETGRSLKTVVEHDTSSVITSIVVGIVAGVVLAAAGGAAGAALAKAIGGAAQAATTTISESATTAVTEVLVEAGEAEIQAAARAGANELEAAATAAQEVGSLFNRAGNVVKNVAGYFKTNWPKILGGMLGGAVAAPVGAYLQIAEALASGDTKKLPTLTSLAGSVSKTVAWSSNDLFEPTAIALHDAVQLSGVIKPKVKDAE